MAYLHAGRFTGLVEESNPMVGPKCTTGVLLAFCAVTGLGTGRQPAARAEGPNPVLLWPDGAPGALGSEETDQPSIRVYAPPEGKNTGAAVVICPGGGYSHLATDHEGHQVAQWYGTIGVTGVVLRYRLGPRYRHPAPLQDVQRAIRYVRSHANELGVAQDRIGVMGFSAGGHLASTAATHFDSGKTDSQDPIDQQSCRPDFAVLAYPVISFIADYSHKGSARNLLGDNPDPELLKALSNDTQVTAETPPTFLFHTGEDTGVPVQNSLAFYQACVSHGVPAELHVYQNGPHGVGLAAGDPVVGTWKDRLADWLLTNGFLADVKRAAVSGTIKYGDKPLRWGSIAFTPVENPRAPTAWALVSNGNFSIPKARGLVVGKNRVTVRTLGDVVPAPTIDGVAVIGGDSSELVFEARESDNRLDLDLPD
jgi:acetyl esterase/lipase